MIIIVMMKTTTIILILIIHNRNRYHNNSIINRPIYIIINIIIRCFVFVGRPIYECDCMT